ncbi:MAG: CHAT domain-containing protein, partial [Pseudomonadota bacterium]
ETDAAFKAIQMNALSSVSEADQRRALSRALDDPDGVALAERLKDAQQQRQTLRSELTIALSQGQNAGTLQGRLAGLDEQIDTLSRRFFADGDTGALLGLSDLSDIQAALTDGEALLMPLTMFRAEALMITNDAVYHSRGERDSALIRESDRTFAETLSGDAPITPDHPFLSELADGLFNQVPMDTISHINVVGALPASSVPLSLVQDPVEPDQFLGQRISITRLPSAAALLRPEPAVDSMARGFLGVGDPAFDGAPQETLLIASVGSLSPHTLMRSGEADLMAIRALPRLPETRTEVSAIADTLQTDNATLLLGQDASEASLRSLDLTRYGIISLATHGLLSGELNGLSEPALVLSPPAEGESDPTPQNDGLLLASEIAELDMDARLIMLSACNSGQGMDTIVGLPQAFLTAGADALMVSRWPVRDDAARFLSVETVKAMEAGQSPAESLRLAVNALRQSDLPNADDPRIFAPFEIVGR